MTSHDHPNPGAIHSAGPLDHLHPTTRYHPVPVTVTRREQQQQQQQQQQHQEKQKHEPASRGHQDATASKVFFAWRSRDNRKGRHRAVVTGRGPKPHGTPTSQSRLKKTARGLSRLVTRFPVWDVSYLVAVAFLLGSVIWCVNGCFAWLPLAAPASEFPGETDEGAGILAFVGATVFEVGSVLMVLEAVNAERSDCFGWALEESLEDHGLSLRPRHEGCRHRYHRRRGALLEDSAVAAMAVTAAKSVSEPGGLDGREGHDGNANVRAEKERRWSWWPTWHDLKTHYVKEIGFLASSVQLLGASIFWISGFTALPPIYDALSVPVMNGVYWVPQVIGGTGFIVSGIMFMIEVQDKWYKPAFKLLGWHVGFWNMIGGIGFTLCPAVGFGSESSPALEYASGLSTFVGSWAFLIGSIAQWYESLDKYPVSAEESPSWLPLGEKAV